MRIHHALWSLVPLVTACTTVPPGPVGGPGVSTILVEATPTSLVYEVGWDDAGDGPAHGGLVVPRHPAPGPGLVYFHQLGRGRNWTQFLEEAKAAATRGVRSVLVDGEYPWMQAWTGLEDDKTRVEAQLQRLRLAVSFLTRQPGVDPQRIGFVGHDYGAMYGALLSAEATPVSRFVFLAPAPTWVSWVVYSQRDPAKLKDYPRFMAALDPLAALRRGPEVPRLVQFSTNDQFLTADEQRAWVGAAPKTEVRFVEGTNHEDLPDAGFAERQAWLFAGWGLLPPGPDLVETVRVPGPRGPILVGKTEVTQAQWRRVKGNSPAWFPGEDRPVEMVTWRDAVDFCNKLSALEGLPEAYRADGATFVPVPGSRGWRLPTRGEWESLSQGKTEGWLWPNSGGETHPVAGWAPSPQGLHDLSGNVREWCEDAHPDDPQSRYVKGGGILSDEKWALPKASEDLLETYDNNDLGLRVVRRAD